MYINFAPSRDGYLVSMYASHAVGHCSRPGRVIPKIIIIKMLQTHEIACLLGRHALGLEFDSEARQS